MIQAKRSKRPGQREHALFEKIFSALLSGEGSCLHTVQGNGFVSSLVDGPQHFALERLLRTFDLPRKFADRAVNAYLERFKRASHRICDTDALAYAQRIADQFPLSPKVAERLVGRMAEAGWYGRLEGCARRYCNRAPTPQEVAFLFKNYMGGASQRDSTDEALTAYAQKYMPRDQAREQLRQLAERNRRFHEETVY